MFSKQDTKNRTKLIRRTVLVFLLILSFLMSSETFAYWADFVQGASGSSTATFTIGSYSFHDYDFVLNGENVEGTFLIDTATLVNNQQPTGETIDVYFGALWEDSAINDEEGTQTIAYIDVSYEIYSEINGSEISSKRYTKVNRILEIDFDLDNPEFLILNNPAQSFGITVGLIQNGRSNDYRVYEKTNTYIIVHYEIIYQTVESSGN